MKTIGYEASEVSNGYHELIYKLMRAKHESGRSEGLAVALVSPYPKAGVSHIARTLAGKMNAPSKSTVPQEAIIVIDSDKMIRSECPFGRLVSTGLSEFTLDAKTNQDVTLRDRLRRLLGDWERDEAYRAECFAAVRESFKLTLIDCSSLKANADICAIAPHVDGVVVVVEADKTTRTQIEHLLKTITAAGGTVLGFVFNKRSYPIPGVLYRFLERGGMA